MRPDESHLQRTDPDRQPCPASTINRPPLDRIVQQKTFDVERLICETCDLEALEASIAKMIRGEARGKILVRVTGG